MYSRNEVGETHILQKAAENQCQTARSTCFGGDSFHINAFLCTAWTTNILNLRLSASNSLVSCWQNVQCVPRRIFNINTLQQWVLHTHWFSCQNRKVSMFLLLPMGAGKGKCYYSYQQIQKKLFENTQNDCVFCCSFRKFCHYKYFSLFFHSLNKATQWKVLFSQQREQTH